jgi:hypothetical protein
VSLKTLELILGWSSVSFIVGQAFALVWGDRELSKKLLEGAIVLASAAVVIDYVLRDWATVIGGTCAVVLCCWLYRREHLL